MDKKNLGTKRIDPETGKKFYDLNKDPIISPYTNISYPRSYFNNESDHKKEGSNNLLSAELQEKIDNNIKNRNNDDKKL